MTLLLTALGSGVSAQEHHDRDSPWRREHNLRFDQRYHHDHYYPSRGYVMPGLPRGAISIGFGGGSYYYQGGVWFRPAGARFVVAMPPMGISVPMLPPAFATLWIGGVPYYYANDVYYVRSPASGYTVVAPPTGAQTVQPASVPMPVPLPPPEPVIYPRNGQSAAQLEADRQDCNRWATTQSGAMADAQVFERATAACMDGRGYTVR